MASNPEPYAEAVRIVAEALCPGDTWTFDQYDDSPEEIARIAVDALVVAGLLSDVPMSSSEASQ